MIRYETLKSFCGVNDIHTALNYACRRKDGWWATDGKRIICVPMEECQEGDVRFLCDEMPKEIGRFPNVEAVVDVEGFYTRFVIPVKALEDALDKLPLTDEMKEVEHEMKFIKCPECDGKGEIEFSHSVHFRGRWLHAEATCECPVCHGHGQIPDKEDYNPTKDDCDPDSPKYSTMVKTGKKIPNVDGTLIHIKDNAYFKASFAPDLLRVAREQGVDEIECKGSNYKDILLFRMHGVIVGLMPIFNGDDKLDYIDIEVKTETE